MSITLRKCIMSCFFKGDKPCKYLKNWQSISLLSVLYKLASTTLTESFEKGIQYTDIEITNWADKWKVYR